MENFFEVNEKATGKPYIIYGAGTAGMDLMVELINRGIEVDYFCDSSPDKWGIELFNKKVLSIKELEEFKESHNIIIASQFFDEIEKDLCERGFNSLFCYSNRWRIII